VPTFSTPARLCEQQHLHEELLQFGQEHAPKGGQRIVVGMPVACDETERHRLIRRTLNLTRAEHPGRIAIEQQAQQHFGGIRFPTAQPIMGVQGREVKLGHTIHHKARQMVGRQAIAQPHRQIERPVVVYGFKWCTHEEFLSPYPGNPGIQPPVDRFQHSARTVQSHFFTMDVAKRRDGE